MSSQKNFICLLILVLICSCGIQSADLIITNGKIITLNEENPQAEAIAIKGDKILALGSSLKIDKYRTNSTKVIDIEKHLVLPGFIDAHCHFAAGGNSLQTLDLRGVNSIEKIQEMVAAKIAELPQGAIINGNNYDHTLFPGGNFPTKQDLDKVSPNNPVIIERVDGHSCWVNSLTLKQSNIIRKTKDPFGGEIVRDRKTRRPTGILKESAMNLINVHGQGENQSQNTLEDIELALKHAAKLGVTGIHTSAGLVELAMYRNLRELGKLTTRVYAWQNLNQLDTLINLGIKVGDGDSLVRVGFLKSFIDGSLGSGTALFFAPFDDNPNTSGLAQYPEEEFQALIARAHRLGYQTGTHAIGSKGVNWVLNAHEFAQQQYEKKGLRHRIEHAQVIIEEDFIRFADLDIIASMQPTHCTTDLRFCEQRIGKERSKGAYAWRSLLDQNVHLAFGTDWPVEPLDPMRGIYSAVTRKNIEQNIPEGGWFPEQKLTVLEAIKYYTIGSAYASFEEDIKGTLEAGKLADLIVLDQDLFSIPTEEILTTRVLYTLLGGKVIFKADSL
jgi:hypothetical protein